VKETGVFIPFQSQANVEPLAPEGQLLGMDILQSLHYTTTHFGPHIEMWAKGTCADKKTVGESFPDRIITVAVEAVGLAFADS
jgi:hypothetical protein